MSAQVQLLASVAAAVEERWGSRGSVWAQAVESELEELSVERGLRPYRVLPSRYSYVVVADSPRGDLVLRATPDPRSRHQADVSRMLAECHAGPPVHEVVATETGLWTLMARVVPGLSLADAAPGSVTTEDLASLFRAMSAQRAPVDELPRIADWLAERLASEKLSDIPVGQSAASSSERADARSLLAELEAAGLRDSLCHGDAHPGNLLVATGPRRVLLVDPRGMRGDTAYDVGVLALKAARYDHNAARELASELASLAGIDAGRAVCWVEVARTARV